MRVTRLLLVAPPVLHGAGWWSNRDAGKPHIESLAAHVAALRDVAVVELDRDDDPSLHYLGRAWIGREPQLAAFGRTVRGVNARWRARWTAETRIPGTPRGDSSADRSLPCARLRDPQEDR